MLRRCARRRLLPHLACFVVHILQRMSHRLGPTLRSISYQQSPLNPLHRTTTDWLEQLPTGPIQSQPHRPLPLIPVFLLSARSLSPIPTGPPSPLLYLAASPALASSAPADPSPSPRYWRSPSDRLDLDLIQSVAHCSPRRRISSVS